VLSYIGETILTWTTSKVLWSGIYSFLYILLYLSQPRTGFSVLIFEVSWSHTTTRHSR